VRRGGCPQVKKGRSGREKEGTEHTRRNKINFKYLSKPSLSERGKERTTGLSTSLLVGRASRIPYEKASKGNRGITVDVGG